MIGCLCPFPDMIILRKSLFPVFTINLAALVSLPGAGGRVWLAKAQTVCHTQSSYCPSSTGSLMTPTLPRWPAALRSLSLAVLPDVLGHLSSALALPFLPQAGYRTSRGSPKPLQSNLNGWSILSSPCDVLASFVTVSKYPFCFSQAHLFTVPLSLPPHGPFLYSWRSSRDLCGTAFTLAKSKLETQFCP